MNMRNRVQNQAEWWYGQRKPSYGEWQAFLEGQASAMIITGAMSIFDVTIYTADMLDLYDQWEDEQC